MFDDYCFPKTRVTAPLWQLSGIGMQWRKQATTDKDFIVVCFGSQWRVQVLFKIKGMYSVSLTAFVDRSYQSGLFQGCILTVGEASLFYINFSLFYQAFLFTFCMDLTPFSYNNTLQLGAPRCTFQVR